MRAVAAARRRSAAAYGTAPSETEQAKAFLARLRKRSVQTLARVSTEEIPSLCDAMMALPARHAGLQVQLPRLLTPETMALLVAIEDDDINAIDEAAPPIVRQLDTPLERVRLAEVVMKLALEDDIHPLMAANALFDLASPELTSMITSGVVYAVTVTAGAMPTPSGLLLAS